MNEFMLKYFVGGDAAEETERAEAARVSTMEMVEETAEKFKVSDQRTLAALCQRAWAIRRAGDYSPVSFGFAAAAVHYGLRELVIAARDSQPSVGGAEMSIEVEACAAAAAGGAGDAALLQRLAAGWLVSRIRPQAASARATVVLGAPPSASSAVRVRHALVYVDGCRDEQGVDGESGRFLRDEPLYCLMHSGFEIVDLVDASCRSGRPAAYVLLASYRPRLSPLGDSVVLPDGFDSELVREQCLVLSEGSEYRVIGSDGTALPERHARDRGMTETHRVEVPTAGRGVSYRLLQCWRLQDGMGEDDQELCWPFDPRFLRGGPSPIEH
jgi:hypothetical protein